MGSAMPPPSWWPLPAVDERLVMPGTRVEIHDGDLMCIPMLMRTSVDIPGPLLRRAKKFARERSTTVRQLLLDGLRSVVERDAQTSGYEMQDCSFGSDGLVEGLSWSDSERIDEPVY